MWVNQIWRVIEAIAGSGFVNPETMKSTSIGTLFNVLYEYVVWSSNWIWVDPVVVVVGVVARLKLNDFEIPRI